ncbi:Phospholipase [Dirofilaria immitis]
MKLYAVRIVVQSEIVQRSSAISKEIGDKPMCSESLILIACLFCAPVAVLDPVLKALWNLDRMSICKLGYPASVYNNYGCWCGVGGSGKPMDGIDRLHFSSSPKSVKLQSGSFALKIFVPCISYVSSFLIVLFDVKVKSVFPM